MRDAATNIMKERLLPSRNFAHLFVAQGAQVIRIRDADGNAKPSCDTGTYGTSALAEGIAASYSGPLRQLKARRECALFLSRIRMLQDNAAFGTAEHWCTDTAIIAVDGELDCNLRWL
jgi:hypothetical protein